jgi:glycosyltransferase involved in cell wall biosynthesis
LAQSPQTIVQLRDAALDKASDFDLETIARQYVELYKDMLA